MTVNFGSHNDHCQKKKVPEINIKYWFDQSPFFDRVSSKRKEERNAGTETLHHRHDTSPCPSPFPGP